MTSKFNLLVEEILTKGLADNKSLQDIADHHHTSLEEITQQYNKGKKVEMEHTSNKDAAGEITKDHLWENPKYYDKLKEIEDKVDESCWDGYERDYSKPQYSKGSCKRKIVKRKKPVTEKLDKDKMPCNKPRYLKKDERGSGGKKSVVKACKDGKEKIVKFGDANMKIKKSNPKNRKNFRSRHNCEDKKDKFSAGYWSCSAW